MLPPKKPLGTAMTSASGATSATSGRSTGAPKVPVRTVTGASRRGRSVIVPGARGAR